MERRADYTSQVVDSMVHKASGASAVQSAARLALVEACVGLFARAFAMLRVSPDTNATKALTAPVLAHIARCLVLRGEVVMAIEVRAGRVALYPVAAWDIRGAAPHRDGWIYQCDLPAPSGSITRDYPADSVVHCQWEHSAETPWFSRSPAEIASSTADLLSWTEQQLTRESRVPVGRILPLPQSPPQPASPDGDPVPDPAGRLRDDVRRLAGGVLLPETTSGGWDDGAAPRRDWEATKIGADHKAGTVDTYTAAVVQVAGALGVPAPMVLSGVDATSRREAYRQWAFSSLDPMVEVVRHELAAKLNEPGLSLSTERTAAADLQSRARSYASLRQAGMEDADARRIAGLE